MNAWELLLKAYIARELRSVKLFKKDGTTKPFNNPSIVSLALWGKTLHQ